MANSIVPRMVLTARERGIELSEDEVIDAALFMSHKFPEQFREAVNQDESFSVNIFIHLCVFGTVIFHE